MAAAEAGLRATEQSAAAGRTEWALATLSRVYDLSLPAKLRHRVIRSYLSLFAQRVLEALSEKTTLPEPQSVCVAPFLCDPSHTVLSGSEVARQILKTLSESGYSARLIQLPERVQERLLRNGTLPPDLLLVAPLRQGELLITGRVDRDILAWSVQAGQGRCEILAVGRNAPGPHRLAAAWEKLICPHSKRGDFAVYVWSERSTYHVGAQLRLFLRATKECFAAIGVLNSDGTVFSFLPVCEGRENFLLSHKTYTIPNRDGLPFALPLSGPPGVEFITVVASRHPLDMKPFSENVTGGRFLRALTEWLAEHDPSSYAITGCRVRVVN